MNKPGGIARVLKYHADGGLRQHQYHNWPNANLNNTNGARYCHGTAMVDLIIGSLFLGFAPFPAPAHIVVAQEPTTCSTFSAAAKLTFRATC